MNKFLFGLAIGIGLGILFAPERGEHSRSKLKRYAVDALDRITEEFSRQTEDAQNDEDEMSGVSRTPNSEKKQREEMLDKTLADSFPSSDPPSSIPDPLPADRNVP